MTLCFFTTRSEQTSLRLFACLIREKCRLQSGPKRSTKVVLRLTFCWEVQALLKDFILEFRTTTTRFYYHTDLHAIDRVVAALKVCAPEQPTASRNALIYSCGHQSRWIELM